jgi:hypothetical protein
MFEVMKESEGNVIGVRMSGTAHKADYGELVPKVEALARQFGDIRMLCDLGDFKSEAADAWIADLKFGREFHEKTSKMAIVGDKRWESWMAKLAAPLYAKEARYFHSADMSAAWAWVKA